MNISDWKAPEWNPTLEYSHNIPDPETQHDLLKFDPQTMKVEVRYTVKTPIPKNSFLYDFTTYIVLHREGNYAAVAKISYEMAYGVIRETGSFLMMTVGGYCQDTTTLEEEFADLITWDFSKAGEFSQPAHTVEVDGNVAQLTECGGGASSDVEQKEKIEFLGVNRVRVIVNDGYQNTQNHVKVEYRITNCKYLHNMCFLRNDIFWEGSKIVKPNRLNN